MIKTLGVLTLLLINPILTESIEQLMREATKHNANREFEKAYKISIKALEISPKDPYALFYIGDYHGWNGDFEKAIDYYNKAIKNHDEIFAVAYYQKAITNMVLNQDLSYCSDIKIITEHFKTNDQFSFLKDEHPMVFGLCDITELSSDKLIFLANELAKRNHCTYAHIVFNEAKKEGTRYDIEQYDTSICGDKGLN